MNARAFCNFHIFFNFYKKRPLSVFFSKAEPIFLVEQKMPATCSAAKAADTWQTSSFSLPSNGNVFS